jgi:hypothetical protein
MPTLTAERPRRSSSTTSRSPPRRGCGRCSTGGAAVAVLLVVAWSIVAYGSLLLGLSFAP